MEENLRRSELVDLVYAALLGESSWGAFFDRLVDRKGDGWTALVSHDARAGEGMFGHYYGCDETLVSDYETHFAAINPWAPQCVAKPAGMAVIGNDLVARDRFVQTEFFNDFFLPYGTQDGTGVTIVKNETRSVMLSVMTADQDHDQVSMISERLAHLYPHLRRAADFYRRREGQEISGFGAQLFDAIDVGVIVVGEGMRPQSVSPAATAMINLSPQVSILPTGRLHIADGPARALMQRMLRRGYEGEKSACFRMGPLKLTITRIEKDRLSWYFSGPTVIVLIEPQGALGGRFDPEGFVARFALTPAECRALLGLVDGKSYSQIGVEAGVSLETIRTQVKSLYLKTGVNSRAGLLRLAHTPLI